MNKNLHIAKKLKDDEFYTTLSEIEKELKHYTEHFSGAVVYCNCDDPRESNFFKYFSDNFETLGLKKLIATAYKEGGKGVKVEYYGKGCFVDIKELDGDGSFESPECIELLKESTIVCSNPPFSRFREYVAQLVSYDKKFLIIGSMNGIAYSEIFPLAQANKLWLGHNNTGMDFIRPDGSLKHVWAVWYSSLVTSNRKGKMRLHKRYNEEDYPTYENYPAINCNKVNDIPVDYDGEVGVPITFMYKYNPDQFDITRFRKGLDGKDLSVDGEGLYCRIVVRNKNPQKPNPDEARLREVAQRLMHS